MLHSRKLNNRINKLQYRALKLTYQDENSSFDDLLERDNSFTIHERNIQSLNIELFKVAYGIAPEIMRLIFRLSKISNIPGKTSSKLLTIKLQLGELSPYGILAQKYGILFQLKQKRSHLNNLRLKYALGNLFVPVECVRPIFQV